MMLAAVLYYLLQISVWIPVGARVSFVLAIILFFLYLDITRGYSIGKDPKCGRKSLTYSLLIGSEYQIFWNGPEL